MSPQEQAADVIECLKAGAGAIHLHVRVTSGADAHAVSVDLQPASNESSRQDEHPIGAAPRGTPLVCAPSAHVVVPTADVVTPSKSLVVASEGARGSDKESLYAEDVARTLLAVRAAAPNAAIGVSTGAWILPDTAARFEAVAGWDVFPDFASVNFSEDGAVELARLLLSRGVEVEAGLSDAADAEVFLKSDLAASCVRVLLEPQEQKLARALETVNAIERAFVAAGEKVLAARTNEARFPPLLLHGADATAWPMLDEAIARGYDVRIGLEDTTVMADGRIAKDNAELVTEAVRRARAVKR